MRRRIFTMGALMAIAAIAGIGAFTLDAIADAYSEPGGVPRLIPFRGHLESGGSPVTSAVTIEAQIYDAPTAGAVLWGPETHAVTPSEGDFTLMLGSSTALPPSVLAGGDAWVAVTVNGVDLAGRQRLASAPYALRSAVSERAESATGALATALAESAPAGSVVMWFTPAPPPGWLLLDGGTIGNATSGATALADDSAEELFALLWEGLDNSVLPIQDASGAPSARGASADADFAAGRRMPLPNGAGLVPRGAGTQLVNGRSKIGPALGARQEDQMQGHRHVVKRASNNAGIGASAGGGDYMWSVNTLGGTSTTHRIEGRDIISDGTNGPTRIGAETRPSSFGVNYIIKI